MAKLDETLDVIVQRTGGTTGAPQNDSEAAAFRSGIRLDMAAIVNQLNNVYYELADALSKEEHLDALDFGITGDVIFTEKNATAASADAFWSSTQGRSRTVKETVDVLLTEISRLENEINFTVDVDAYDDSDVRSLIGNNQLNLTQLVLDTQGSNYTLDNDGLVDLTHSLSRHLDALGAFFTGFPGTGNTYSGTYPTLTLAVNLSDVVIDTTVPQSAVTSLTTDLGNVRTYTGMTNAADSSPTYSTHGAITTVADATSLEVAIQALDAGLAASSGAFSTTTNVTSNSAGDYTSDDFVFGSPALDDNGTVAHDSRFFFDKSKSALRAGSVPSTTWDDGSRGDHSVAFGENTTASGGHSVVLGGEDNIAAGAYGVIAGGGGAATGNTIGATTTTSFIGAGSSNAIGSISSANGSAIASGSLNKVDALLSFIGSGLSNTVDTQGSVIAGGLSNEIITSGSENFIGAGNDNAIVASTSAVIVGGGKVSAGGVRNIVDGSDAAGIVVGSNNGIFDSVGAGIVAGNGNLIGTNASGFDADYSVIGSGLTNSIVTTAADSKYCVIAGGSTNTITESANAFIGAGSANTIGSTTASTHAVIVGGNGSSINNSGYGVIAGGIGNALGTGGAATYGVIGGGDQNGIGEVTGATHGVVVGGQQNYVDKGNFSSIVGGFQNNIGFTATATYGFIGGGDLNAVDSVHSSIVGGDTNTITGGTHHFIGGGLSNTIVNNSYNSIVGGNDNTITAGFENFIGGGEDNVITAGNNNFIGGGGGAGTGGNTITSGSMVGIVCGANHTIGANASANNSVITGGEINTIDRSTHSFIGGGSGNDIGSTTAANYSVIAGGFSHEIDNGTYGFIGGGDTNSISGATHGTISGGDNNSVTANYGTVVGGGNNIADSIYGTAIGNDATTDNHGVVAHADGAFSTAGDAQSMRAVWRTQTTDATAAVEMFLDGSAQRFVLDSDSTYAFSILLVGRRTDADGESGGYKFEGVIDNNAGTTALVGTVTKTVLAEDTAGWDADVVADDTNDSIKIQVTGIAANNINWVASGDIVKVTG